MIYFQTHTGSGPKSGVFFPL